VIVKKIIFLDIDGVLNSRAYTTSEVYLQATAGISNAELMLSRHDLRIDPLAVDLLNDLIDKSGADVVLSSTWRGKYSPDDITKLMATRGFKFKITDSTPILFGKVNSSRIPRGKEIASYLRNLPQWPDGFVILDDNDDMLTLINHLILTSKKLGLTAQDVEKALKILHGEINDVPQTT
jgi:HAD domain in Swiss Army Knife RNA repair proteins